MSRIESLRSGAQRLQAGHGKDRRAIEPQVDVGGQIEVEIETESEVEIQIERQRGLDASCDTGGSAGDGGDLTAQIDVDVLERDARLDARGRAGSGGRATVRSTSTGSKASVARIGDAGSGVLVAGCRSPGSTAEAESIVMAKAAAAGSGVDAEARVSPGAGLSS